MKHYPHCPEPTPRAWTFPLVGTVSLAQPTFEQIGAVARLWEPLRRPSDTNGWEWLRVFTDARDCVYALGLDPVVALYGTTARNLDLGGVPTRRLNYFQIAPNLRGSGIAQLAFAVFARMTADFEGTELVVPSLPEPKVVKFYLEMAGVLQAPRNWQAPKGLISIHFDPARLITLAEYADALEEKTQP